MVKRPKMHGHSEWDFFPSWTLKLEYQKKYKKVLQPWASELKDELFQSVDAHLGYKSLRYGASAIDLANEQGFDLWPTKFCLLQKIIYCQASSDSETGESSMSCGLDIPFHLLALASLLAPNWKTAPSPIQLQTINKALLVEFPFISNLAGLYPFNNKGYLYCFITTINFCLSRLSDALLWWER